MHKFLITLFALFVFSSPSFASGEMALALCQQNPNTMKCQAYLKGAISGMRPYIDSKSDKYVVSKQTDMRFNSICFPDNFQDVELMEAILNTLINNPKTQKQDITEVIYPILLSKYPCKK